MLTESDPCLAASLGISGVVRLPARVPECEIRLQSTVAFRD